MLSTTGTATVGAVVYRRVALLGSARVGKGGSESDFHVDVINERSLIEVHSIVQ